MDAARSHSRDRRACLDRLQERAQPRVRAQLSRPESLAERFLNGEPAEPTAKYRKLRNQERVEIMNAPKDGSVLDLDFDLEALLERDSHTLFHPQMLRNLRGELERELGGEGARVAALQMGCLLGMRDGRAAAETLLWTDSAGKPAQNSALPMRFGCASRVNSALAPHGQWPATSEARAHRERSRDACLISMGYTSGWLSEATGTEVLALETSCCPSINPRAPGHTWAGGRHTALERV